MTDSKCVWKLEKEYWVWFPTCKCNWKEEKYKQRPNDNICPHCGKAISIEVEGKK